jgi:hypothetical protein
MCDTTILCLANSRKPPSGRCIAGKRYKNGKTTEWVRPISSRASHEVSEDERRYEGGTKAQLLDVIFVPMLHASPSGHQIENFTLDPDYYWRKEGVASWDDVRAAVDPHDSAFWSFSQSTYHGLNDKVAESDVGKVGSSLKLILVKDLRVSVNSEMGYEGNPARRRARAEFNYGEASYRMSITDPEIEERYLVKGNGEYTVGEAALCISLAEVWNGFAFRLVASLITAERCN